MEENGSKKFSSNVNAASTSKQFEGAKTPKNEGGNNNNFDEAKYLHLGLENGEKERDVTIRLLPITPESETPFMQVYAHMVRVSTEVSPSGWKRVLCPVSNGVEHDTDKCPFCTIAKKALAGKKGLTKESQTWKDLNSVEFANSAKLMWVCRCIERGHENEGVKWWMFPAQANNGDGIRDKLHAIEVARQKKDSNYTIYDLNEGKDIIITITLSADGKKKSIKINDDDERSPLTTDYELGLSWINDPVRFEDMYKYKPYDYLAILAEGGVPYFDKTVNRFVNKNEETAAPTEIDKAEAEKDLKNAIQEQPKEGEFDSAAVENEGTSELPF